MAKSENVAWGQNTQTATAVTVFQVELIVFERWIIFFRLVVQYVGVPILWDVLRCFIQRVCINRLLV
jgi:hypothetical protein